MCHPESFLNFYAPEFDMKMEASTDRRGMAVTRHTQVTACLFSRHLQRSQCDQIIGSSPVAGKSGNSSSDFDHPPGQAGYIVEFHDRTSIRTSWLNG